MRHPTLNPVEREADLTRLDEMIGEVARLRDSELLREHLQSARQYLFGAMPKEYLLSLEWARAALDTVPAGDLRNRLDKTIAGLIADMFGSGPHRSQPPE